MNLLLITLEFCVVVLGLVLLMADLWCRPIASGSSVTRAAGLGVLLIVSLAGVGSCGTFGSAFHDMFVHDGLSLFFDRSFSSLQCWCCSWRSNLRTRLKRALVSITG